MASSLPVSSAVTPSNNGRIPSFLVATNCLLRGLPLFFASRPGTPLRVLCIIALDTVSCLRGFGHLPKIRIEALASLLDFGALMNAELDGKTHCPDELHKLCRKLEDTGIRPIVREYRSRIHQLELDRPTVCGDDTQCEKTRMYRENVVRLSMGVMAIASLNHATIEDGIRATSTEPDLSLLFSIVMQCQLIDDVFDNSHDINLGLPGFLTGSNDPIKAFQMAIDASHKYSVKTANSESGKLFPFELALQTVSIIAKAMLTLGRWRQRISLLHSAQHSFPAGNP